LEFSTALLAAILGAAVVITLLVYIGALRSQHLQAQAEREHATASEAALREQESWAQLVFDSTSDLMSMHRVEPDGRFVFEFINRSLVEFHAVARPGMSAGDWLGRDLGDLMRRELGFGEAQIDNILAPYREAVRTGQGTPVSHISGQGAHTRYREGLITPLKDASGRVTRLFYRGADVTERRRSAGELRRSADRFAKLFESSPIPILITRLADGQVLEMNEAYVLGTVYTRERLLEGTSQNLGMWIDPGDREAFLKEILSGAKIRNRRMQFRAGDGSVRDYLYSAERIDWHGEQAIVSFPMDVTELEQAHREAQALSERFEKLFELSPVPIVIGSVDTGQYFTANEAWLRLHGYTRAEIEGQTSLSLGVADARDRHRVVDMLLNGAEIRRIPARFRKKSGELFDTLYSATFIEWKGERAIVGIPYDVTELEEARREAQASSERFEKVFDLSPVPVVIGALEDGLYLAANEAWLKLHGYTRDELDGQTSLSLKVWADSADRERLIDLLALGGDIRRIPMRFRKKSGEIFDTLYSATLIDWKGERAIIATPQDVTELNRAAVEIRSLNDSLEDKVKQRTAALEEANRELESFSYSVSHDLRAPLRALSGFSTLLAGRPAVQADEEALGHARRVTAAATRMGTIVDALLRYSRLSRQEIATRPVSLAIEVESLIVEFNQAAGDRRLRWVVGELPVVNGDPTLLRLVLQNLLDNAVKYTARREEAVIEIDARRGEDGIVVRVKDNGVGFDMQHAANLFGVFQRLHADNEFEGTGIGLANAQRIVQRHGGRIWCEASPGRGASFYFSLPD